VELRDATAADCDALARATAGLPLFARYGLSERDLAARLESSIARGEGVVCAYDGEAPAGFALFLTSGTFAGGGYLRLIAVAPASQGQQVGARLLAEVERRVALTSRSLFLLVSDFNRDAQRFYAAHGYREAGRLAGFVKPDIDELIYWKRL
jgi:ribosomal protein S18 acetylase RimI-like enzyme